MKLLTTTILVVECITRAIAWQHATAATLQGALRSSHTLVAFTLPNHQHSEALELEWTKVQEAEGSGRIHSIDCASEPDVCKEHDIASFPAIRLYHGRDKDKRVTRYRGPRKAAAIRSFLARAQRPTISTLTDQNVTSFRQLDDVVFVLNAQLPDIASENPTSWIRTTFEDRAKLYRDRYSFGLLSTSNLEPALTCTNNPNGLELSLNFSGTKSIDAFIRRCAAPLIPALTRGNELQYASKGKSLVHTFISHPDERDAYVAEMIPLAKKYAEYLQFTTIDVTEYPDMPAVYGHQKVGTKGGGGLLSVYHPSNGQIFPYREGHRLSAGVVERFLVDIIAGKVAPWVGDRGEGDEGHEEL